MSNPAPNPDSSKPSKPAPPAEELSREPWQDVVVRGVHGLREGTVKIYVHDSQVVQVEAIERIRAQALPSVGKGLTPKVRKER
jgi:hypothetical protein